MIDKRMMYALGQRVAKTLDGSRPGYRGSDYGDQARGTGAYSGGDSSPAAGGTQGGGTGSGNQNTGSGSTDDRSSNLQDYNHRVAQAARQGLTIPKEQPTLLPREQMQQTFRNFRPEMPKIPLGLGGLFMNMINPGGKGALQMFSDFGAKKNRNYFMDEVVRAGKIPGLNYGTVADMTGTELEAAYKNYLADRGSGSTDAYGNPIGNQEEQGIQNIPLQYGMSPGEAEGIETATNNPFTSRFLQNQPEDIRAEIESRMQNYFTV